MIKKDDKADTRKSCISLRKDVKIGLREVAARHETNVSKLVNDEMQRYIETERAKAKIDNK